MGDDKKRQWAASLLANPLLRNQLCSQILRQPDWNANGILYGSKLSNLSSTVNMHLGLPDFDTSLLDESLAQMGKPAGSSMTLAEFKTFYEICLQVFVAPKVSLGGGDPAVLEAPETAVQEPVEPATMAGELKRRGLHMWNFSWYPVFAELRGSDFHVLDADKTMLGVVALAGQFKVHRQGDCDWRLLPDGDSVSLPDLLAYEWQAGSKTEADDWEAHLSKACSAAGKVVDPDQSVGSLSTTDSSLAAGEQPEGVTAS